MHGLVKMQTLTKPWEGNILKCNNNKKLNRYINCYGYD